MIRIFNSSDRHFEQSQTVCRDPVLLCHYRRCMA